MAAPPLLASWMWVKVSWPRCPGLPIFSQVSLGGSQVPRIMHGTVLYPTYALRNGHRIDHSEIYMTDRFTTKAFDCSPWLSTDTAIRPTYHLKAGKIILIFQCVSNVNCCSTHLTGKKVPLWLVWLTFWYFAELKLTKNTDKPTYHAYLVQNCKQIQLPTYISS